MIHLEIRHRRAIDRVKDTLVGGAEALLDKAKIQDIDTRKLGDSQFKNLLAVANETESPKVVSNFIRYQLGRDTHRASWGAAPAGGRGFGYLLLDELESPDGAVQRALEAASNQLEPLEGTLETLIHIELVRHFLGFAARYRKFKQLQATPRGEGDRA